MKITDELFYNIPTLPIQKFLFGEKLSKELDFSSKTYLLYAMDWSNDITEHIDNKSGYKWIKYSGATNDSEKFNK